MTIWMAWAIIWSRADAGFVCCGCGGAGGGFGPLAYAPRRPSLAGGIGGGLMARLSARERAAAVPAWRRVRALAEIPAGTDSAYRLALESLHLKTDDPIMRRQAAAVAAAETDPRKVAEDLAEDLAENINMDVSRQKWIRYQVAALRAEFAERGADGL